MRQRGRNQNTQLDLIQRSKIKFEKLSMSRPAVILPTAWLDPRFGDKFEYANTLPSKIVNCELYRSKQFCAIYCTPTERSTDSNEYKLNPKRFNISKWLLRITFKANKLLSTLRMIYNILQWNYQDLRWFYQWLDLTKDPKRFGSNSKISSSFGFNFSFSSSFDFSISSVLGSDSVSVQFPA